MAFLHLVTLALVVASGSATNDWSKPCFEGVCENATLPTSGTLKIWGSPNAIADITPAGGWEILGCSTSELDQDIRLVCLEGREEDCNHLFSSNGAIGKVARLPESCGQGPFALISAEWEDEDQDIPEHIARAVKRRDGTHAPVQGLHLSPFGQRHSGRTNGPSARQATESPVYFAVQATNTEGEDLSFDIPTSRISARGDIHRRGLFSWIKKAIEAIKAATRVKYDKTLDLARVAFEKTFNLVDQSISCPPANLQMKVDVDAKANAAANLGVFITGTILPPAIEEFSLAAGLATDLAATLDVAADATGSVNTGRMTLVKVMIPGIDVPGQVGVPSIIFTLGPSFQLDADVKAQLDAYLHASVGVAYSSNNLAVFPPRSNAIKPSSEFSLGNTPLKLALKGDTAGSGTISAHIIPRLNVGVNVFSGVASANVFLDLDASATMELKGSASAELGATPATQYNGCFLFETGVEINIGASANLLGLFDESVKLALLVRDFEIFNQCFGSQNKRALPEARVRRSPLELEFIEARALTCSATGPGKLFDLIDLVINPANVKEL